MSAEPTGQALRLAIRRLAGGESLDRESITGAFDVIMRGEATPAQVAALLMALRVKGETRPRWPVWRGAAPAMVVHD
jgi:anthranilate phosphoribosyltransferase